MQKSFEQPIQKQREVILYNAIGEKNIILYILHPQRFTCIKDKYALTK